MPQPFRLLIRPLLLVWVLILSVPGFAVAAADWAVNVETSDEKVIDTKPDSTLTTRTSERNFEVTFDTFLMPTLEFSSFFTFDRTRTVNEDDFDDTEDIVETGLGLKAKINPHSVFHERASRSWS